MPLFSQTYTFSGNGYWSIATNWSNSLIPPDTLNNGEKIYISSNMGDSCVLDKTQVILEGASIYISTGANFIIHGNLVNYKSPSADSNDIVYTTGDIGMLLALNANTGALIWSFKLDSNANVNSDMILSSPTIDSGIIYIGSLDRNVYAINAQTGVIKWKFKTDDYSDESFPAFESSPIVKNGTVYIGRDKLYAIDANNGTLKWSKKLFQGIITSPCYFNNRILVNAGVHFYSIDATTGVIKGDYDSWNTRNENQEFSASSPCVNEDGYVYIAADGGAGNTKVCMYGFNSQNFGDYGGYGTHRFYSFPEEYGIYFSSPTIFENNIYFAYNHTLYSNMLLPATGNNILNWKFVASGNFPVSSPTVDSSHVFIGSDKGIMYALNTTTGLQDWTFDVKTRGGITIMNSPTLANNILYFASNNCLFALNATTGLEIWHKETFGNYYYQFSPCVISKSGETYHSGISGIKN